MIEDQEEHLHLLEQENTSFYCNLVINVETLYSLGLSQELMNKFITNLQSLRESPILEWIKEYIGEFTITNPSSEYILSIFQKRIHNMKKRKQKKKSWGKEDKEILVWVVSKFCELHFKYSQIEDMTLINWKYISQLVPGTSSSECFFQWLNFSNKKKSQMKWSHEQQNALSKLVDENEQNWEKISLILYLKYGKSKQCYRNPSQCKGHWNFCRNKRKKKWSRKQEIMLFQAKKVQLENAEKQIQNSPLNRSKSAIRNKYRDEMKKGNIQMTEKQFIEKRLMELCRKQSDNYEEALQISQISQKEMVKKEQENLPQQNKLPIIVNINSVEEFRKRYIYINPFDFEFCFNPPYV